MLDTVKINHVQHISFTQSRLTDAVSVILSELLSYEHPSNAPGFFGNPFEEIIFLLSSLQSTRCNKQGGLLLAGKEPLPLCRSLRKQR